MISNIQPYPSPSVSSQKRAMRERLRDAYVVYNMILVAHNDATEALDEAMAACRPYAACEQDLYDFCGHLHNRMMVWERRLIRVRTMINTMRCHLDMPDWDGVAI